MRSDLNIGKFMPRKDFFKCIENVYDDKSTDYLIALRDSLSILISNRIGGNKYAAFKYEGFIKYD